LLRRGAGRDAYGAGLRGLAGGARRGYAGFDECAFGGVGARADADSIQALIDDLLAVISGESRWWVYSILWDSEVVGAGTIPPKYLRRLGLLRSAADYPGGYDQRIRMSSKQTP
jgi:hypothetical protein